MNPVRPEHSERRPHAMEVEGVDVMDAEPESAHASESEEAMESSEGNGAKS